MNRNLDIIISSYKPPIFWKDKEIVKKQLLCWTTMKLENLIIELNDIELNIKKNSYNSINIIYDFILEICKKTSN